MADVPVRDHHYRPRQRPVKSRLTGRLYRWELKAGLYLCMVDERDLQFVKAVTKGCCGSRGRFYKQATQEEHEKWLKG